MREEHAKLLQQTYRGVLAVCGFAVLCRRTQKLAEKECETNLWWMGIDLCVMSLFVFTLVLEGVFVLELLLRSVFQWSGRQIVVAFEGKNAEKDFEGLTKLTRHILRRDYEALDPDFGVFDQILKTAGAEEYWHKHSTFREHLINTWLIMKTWGQPDDLSRAMLFHSAYSNSFVKMALLLPHRERGPLRELIGAPAESLAYIFCSFNRHKVLIEKVLKEGHVPAEGLKVPHLVSGETLELPQRMVGWFLVMTMADNAEQNFGWQDLLFGHGEGKEWMEGGEQKDAEVIWPCDNRPALMLNHISRLGRIARQAEILQVPPIFDSCTKEISKTTERKARDLYVEAAFRRDRLKAPEREKVRKILETVSELNPFVGEPFLIKAQLLLSDGMWDLASKACHLGLARLSEWGTAWDKRMSWAAWMAWGRALRYQAQHQKWSRDGMTMVSLGTVPLQRQIFEEEEVERLKRRHKMWGAVWSSAFQSNHPVILPGTFRK